MTSCNRKESLLKKPLIVIGVCFGVLLLILLGTSWPVFLGSFLSLEDREMVQDVMRALSSFNNNIAHLNISAGDYSGWDESYRFVRDGNPEFIKTNLDDKIFPMLRIDMLLYVDLSGKTIYEKGIDHLSGKRFSLESIHSYISRDSPLVRHETPDSNVFGVLLLPEGPLLVASRPILTSQFKGPVRGALIMGRYLDTIEQDRLRDITRLPMKLFTLGDPHLPSDIRTFLETPETDKSLWIQRLGTNEIAGYTLIKNVFGEPALVLKVAVPRYAYRQGLIAIRYFIAWVAGIGLVASIAGYLLYARLLSYRQKELESQARYSSVIQQASEGIILVDLVDKSILEINTAFVDLLGYSTSELRGMTLYDIFSGDPSGVDMDVAEVRKCKQRFLGERTFRRKDGGIVIVEKSANIISGEDREILCMVLRDITKRKRAEEELTEKREQLETLNSTLEQRVREEAAKNREKDLILIQQNRQAAMGELMDHIAHQWKQPLTTLSLTIQLLAETYFSGGLTDKLVKESAGKMEALVQHMSQTIGTFRDFYNPDKKKTVFNIKYSIDMALTFFAPALRFDSIDIELDADPGVSALGHPKEYTQVLLNILSNARDALNETKPEKPLIRIREFAEGNKAVVIIADNAGGIPEAIVSKIFEPYFSTKWASGGTGVGLYMSKNIIEKNMDGRIAVRMIDNGAEFRIEVPCAFPPRE